MSIASSRQQILSALLLVLTAWSLLAAQALARSWDTALR
jgi:hypothetical protein